MKEIRIHEISNAIPYQYTCLPVGNDRFRFIEDSKNPDYVLVIYSHLILSSALQAELKRFYDQNRIFIFYADEAISPDMNIFDYAIVYDDGLVDDDRICRRPTCESFKEYWENAKYQDKLFGRQMITSEEYETRDFCNFIYSNSQAHRERDRIFFELSKYKKVNSLGSHLNNTEIKNTRYEADFFDLSVNLKSKYRFSIAAENNNFKGYTSEKILSSFFANTIPIYWGNPHITDEFNEESFINCGTMPDYEEIRGRIMEINESKSLWEKYVNTPMCTNEQLEYHFNQRKKYEAYLYHIFSQKITEAKRVPGGTWTMWYADWFLRKFLRKENELKHIKDCFQLQKRRFFSKT